VINAGAPKMIAPTATNAMPTIISISLIQLNPSFSILTKFVTAVTIPAITSITPPAVPVKILSIVFIAISILGIMTFIVVNIPFPTSVQILPIAFIPSTNFETSLNNLKAVLNVFIAIAIPNIISLTVGCSTNHLNISTSPLNTFKAIVPIFSPILVNASIRGCQLILAIFSDIILNLSEQLFNQF